MKNILLAIAIFSALNTSAQISKVSLQASGLTCSMCSNAINKALKTIPAVDKVIANIKTSTFEISFKPNSKVDFDELKNKVEAAGFSVAVLTANINFVNQEVTNDEHVKLNGQTFHFLNVKDQTLNGVKTIRIIDKGFVPAKDFKKNEKLTTMECYKTGVAAACCANENITPGSRIYHVTI